MKRILNASQPPKVYYGLHMVEGVAEYREPGSEPYRILIGEKALKNMDSTFQGMPVYVFHVDGVDLNDLGKGDPENPQNKTKEVGYVVRSFFNKADGKHWAEFLIIQDEGHEAIRKKWKLSNAYIPDKHSMGGSGEWHGVAYQNEIRRGKYEHLAIVPNPRYAESVILTAEEFKAYNENAEAELKRIANSKEETEMSKEKKGFSFWKREKVENSDQLGGICVTLPKSKKEVSVEDLLSAEDERLTNAYHCNGDERVKVGDSEMSVNELIAKYGDMQKNMDDGDEDDSMDNEDEDDKGDEKDEKSKGKKENEDEGDEKEKSAKAKKQSKKVNASDDDEDDDLDEDEDEEDSKEAKSHFKKLKNAHRVANDKKAEGPVLETFHVGVERGKARYG